MSADLCHSGGATDKCATDNGSTIRTTEQLTERLPGICQCILDALGIRNLEATYQRSLRIELEDAGIEVREEVSINIVYKGRVVGTRRADLILRTPGDGRISIIELKAVQQLTGEHLKQLEYYMAHFCVETGFLINFPHASGFPDVAELGATFTQLCISGAVGVLPDRRLRKDDDEHLPQIVMVTRCADGAPCDVKTEPQQHTAGIETDRDREAEPAPSGAPV